MEPKKQTTVLELQGNEEDNDVNEVLGSIQDTWNVGAKFDQEAQRDTTTGRVGGESQGSKKRAEIVNGGLWMWRTSGVDKAGTVQGRQVVLIGPDGDGG